MQKLAIIGSGITGLGAAYLLNKQYEIAIFEKNSYVGGHSRTIKVKNSQVDTGFIVFNKINYPNLSALFSELKIPITKSNMSFGLSSDFLEYGTENIASLFAESCNLYNPKFYRMLFDVIKFNNNAKKIVQKHPNILTQDLIKYLKLGDWFSNYYLLAMAAAIWSSPKHQILKFPASTLINFFDNHGLLTINNQPQWYTVKGGSEVYVKILTKEFKDKIRINNEVVNVARVKGGVQITDINGNNEIFDKAIVCCHSDQALKIINNPTQSEKEILSAIRYQTNKVVTHTDSSFMPRNRKAWSSWVYLNDVEQLSLSYWMNNLQQLNTQENIFVTLNPNTMPKSELILDVHKFSHPIFDQAAINAQTRVQTIQGIGGIWYAGAWLKYGFHEDGLASAISAAKMLGAKIPWT